MKEVLIKKSQAPVSPPIRARYCQSFLCRLRGLTFRKHLDREEGLLLVFKRESRFETAIHMLGVNMNLAVFWLDREQKIVDRRLARKWHPFYVPKAPACYVLELAADRLDDFILGETLQFEEISSR
jgi:uncharacterized membrane protein (UPF0127 family)